MTVVNNGLKKVFLIWAKTFFINFTMIGIIFNMKKHKTSGIIRFRNELREMPPLTLTLFIVALLTCIVIFTSFVCN